MQLLPQALPLIVVKTHDGGLLLQVPDGHRAGCCAGGQDVCNLGVPRQVRDFCLGPLLMSLLRQHETLHILRGASSGVLKDILHRLDPSSTVAKL